MVTTKSGNPHNMVDLQRIALWVGTLVLVVDAMILIVLGYFEQLITACLFIGLMAISMNLWPYIGLQKPTRDERAAKIGAIAGLASWYISLFVTVVAAVVLAYLPTSFGVHPTLAQGIGGVILVMVLSMIVIYEYLIRKSDLGW